MSGQPGCYVEGGSQTTEQPSPPPSTTSLPETTYSPPETSTTDGGEDKEYLFVVGGGSTLKKTEIVSLTEGESIPDCLNALSDHPNQLYYSAGGALPDASYQPHICGSYYSPYDECWAYTPSDDTWTKKSTIPRDFVSGGSAFHPGWGIIMSGGFVTNEVTLTKDGVEFEQLEPVGDIYYSYFHCIAAVNSSMLFTTGLGSNDDESYMYYKDTKEWVSLPNMPTRREGMGCGVVRDENGKIEVVVVGGGN